MNLQEGNLAKMFQNDSNLRLMSLLTVHNMNVARIICELPFETSYSRMQQMSHLKHQNSSALGRNG